MSFVYVMQVAPAVVKVGRSNIPERRAHQLTRVWGQKVAVVFKLHCGNAPAVELAAHRMLAAYRIEGEWFSVEAQEAIRAIEVAASVVVPMRQDVPMRLRLEPFHVLALREFIELEPDNPSIGEMLVRLVHRELIERKQNHYVRCARTNRR